MLVMLTARSPLHLHSVGLRNQFSMANMVEAHSNNADTLECLQQTAASVTKFPARCVSPISCGLCVVCRSFPTLWRSFGFRRFGWSCPSGSRKIQHSASPSTTVVRSTPSGHCEAHYKACKCDADDDEDIFVGTFVATPFTNRDAGQKLSCFKYMLFHGPSRFCRGVTSTCRTSNRFCQHQRLFVQKSILSRFFFCGHPLGIAFCESQSSSELVREPYFVSLCLSSLCLQPGLRHHHDSAPLMVGTKNWGQSSYWPTLSISASSGKGPLDLDVLPPQFIETWCVYFVLNGAGFRDITPWRLRLVQLKNFTQLLFSKGIGGGYCVRLRLGG